ncbi:hypothetical protein FF38_11373 [Lucilia cuprina]|uniref:Uncharacterized protein n=1 Tax=Lucilia cuprina TaxID=7375 RepID=A0A0L0C388_LUCCU|nr:hypothetical protein FF38_11373 [Lucilia cuprina]
MENSPPAASSLEKQIDNFLEHFKRSASKAMEAEWCSIGGNSSNTSNSGSGVTGSTATTTVINTSTTTTTSEMVAGSQPALQTPKQMSFEKHQHLLQRTRSRSSCLDLNNMMTENI